MLHIITFIYKHMLFWWHMTITWCGIKLSFVILHLGFSEQMPMSEPSLRSVWWSLSLGHVRTLTPAKIFSPGGLHMHHLSSAMWICFPPMLIAKVHVFRAECPLCPRTAALVFFLCLQVFLLLQRCWGHRQLPSECLSCRWRFLCCNRNQLPH